MTVSELCDKLQTIAHNGHAKDEIELYDKNGDIIYYSDIIADYDGFGAVEVHVIDVKENL